MEFAGLGVGCGSEEGRLKKALGFQSEGIHLTARPSLGLASPIFFAGPLVPHLHLSPAGLALAEPPLCVCTGLSCRVGGEPGSLGACSWAVRWEIGPTQAPTNLQTKRLWQLEAWPHRCALCLYPLCLTWLPALRNWDLHLCRGTSGHFSPL